VTLPNFLIIGGVKCGTTSLYQYLIQHPDVFMPPRLKEPRFFCYDGRPSTLKLPIKTLEAYSALFDEVTTEKAIGEASPHYFTHPHAAGAIKGLIPNAKLILSLRHPVDRAHSEYLMGLRSAGKSEAGGFLDAMTAQPDLVSDSLYDIHLERFYGLFPRDQVKIIMFEQLAKNTTETVQSILEFLSVDTNFFPEVGHVPNPGGIPKSKLIYSLSQNRHILQLKEFIPKNILRMLRRARKANMQSIKLTQKERESALPIFRDSIRRTEQLIQQDLSHWLVV
jgi:hypothetical protein